MLQSIEYSTNCCERFKPTCPRSALTVYPCHTLPLQGIAETDNHLMTRQRVCVRHVICRVVYTGTIGDICFKFYTAKEILTLYGMSTDFSEGACL